MHTPETIPAWKKVFRDGIAPSLSDDSLEYLLGALERDDPELVQGSTTVPPPLMIYHDYDCNGGCAVAYAIWKGEGIRLIGELEEKWAAVLWEADQRLGEPAAVRYFLNFWDDTPREVVRRELSAEIWRIMRERAEQGVAA